MRRPFSFLLLTLLFLAAVLGGLLLVRHEAAEMAIRQILAAEGLDNASFEVTHLHGDRARVEDLVFGRYRNLRADAVEVRFAGLGTWRVWSWTPVIEQLTVVGLRVRLNPNAAGGPLNDPVLEALLDGAGTQPEAAIPPLMLEDAVVTLVLPEGNSRLELNGRIERPEGAPLDGRFTYRLTAPQGSASGEIALQQQPAKAPTVTRSDGGPDGSPYSLGSMLLLNIGLARARAGDLTLEQLALALPLAVERQDRQVGLSLRAPGTLSIEDAQLEGESLLREAVSLTVTGAGIARSRDGSWQLRLTAESGGLRLRLPGGARLDLEGLTIALESDVEAGTPIGRLGLEAKDAALPDDGFTLSALSLEAPFPPGRLAEASGRLSVGHASVNAGGTRVSGIAFAGTLTESGGAYRLHGKGHGPNGQGDLTASLQHDRESGRGHFKAVWGPVTFDPDGLQPAALSTLLEGLEAVTGKMTLTAEGSWMAQNRELAAKVTLKDLSGTHLPARVGALSADLNFSGLTPPVTLEDQLIVIEELDVGVPLKTLLAVFAVVDTEGGPALDVKEIQTDFSGGRLTLSPFRVNAAADPLSTTMEIAHVKLDRLSHILGLGDVQLVGRIIGQLPLTLDIEREEITIANGWIQAVDGGLLRIPDATARLGLPAAGEQQPSLLSALAALAEFRYTYLYATVSLDAAGGLELALTLEGSNPAVQEGYPLTLTVAFGIDLADLLAAFRYGREIGPKLFDGAWSLK